MSQSTSDFYPTSLHVAIILMNQKLLPELQALIKSFEAKGKEFENILKMGRTELQDAVPMTLGQEVRRICISAESFDRMNLNKPKHSFM